MSWVGFSHPGPVEYGGERHPDNGGQSLLPKTTIVRATVLSPRRVIGSLSTEF